MADPKSHDLLNLLANDRTLDSTSARQQISYRMNAEGILGSDENLYRIEWVRPLLPPPCFLSFCRKSLGLATMVDLGADCIRLRFDVDLTGRGHQVVACPATRKGRPHS
jgi:hypothetical protein